MSLLDDIKALLDENESLNLYEVEDEVENVETVLNEFVYSGRWTEQYFAVFKRGDEYVGLDYELPSTEMQEGSEGESEVYEVEPYEVVVTKYQKKADY